MYIKQIIKLFKERAYITSVKVNQLYILESLE